MEDLLKDIKHHYNNNAYNNEESVRLQICTPILRKLDWNTDSPIHVHPEYIIKPDNLKVDIALLELSKPIIFIEVKAPGKIDLAGETQLFNYANLHSGIPMVVLTDGNEWHFFNSYGIGNYQNRKVKSLYLCKDDLLDCSNILKRYLKYENVKNEQAFNDLREDYQKSRSENEARNSIIKAWQKLVNDEDTALIDSLINKTEKICQSLPIKKDVVNFLNNLEYRKIDDNSDIPLPIYKIQNNELSSGKISRKYSSSNAKYKINGTEFPANNGKNAYLEALDYIIDKYGNFEQLKSQEFNRITSSNKNWGDNGKGYHYSESKSEIPIRDKQKYQLAKTGIWINVGTSSPDKEKKLNQVGAFYNQKIGRKILGEWGSGAEVEYSIPTRES